MVKNVVLLKLACIFGIYSCGGALSAESRQSSLVQETTSHVHICFYSLELWLMYVTHFYNQTLQITHGSKNVIKYYS